MTDEEVDPIRELFKIEPSKTQFAAYGSPLYELYFRTEDDTVLMESNEYTGALMLSVDECLDSSSAIIDILLCRIFSLKEDLRYAKTHVEGLKKKKDKWKERYQKLKLSTRRDEDYCCFCGHWVEGMEEMSHCPKCKKERS